VIERIPSLDELKSDACTSAAHQALIKRLRDEVIEPALKLPLSEKTEGRWDGAFHGMEICLYRTPTVQKSLRYVLNTHQQHSSSFVRAAMEAVWTLYRSEFVPEMEKVARETKNPKNFAMAVNYIVMNDPKKAKEYYELSFRAFPDNKNEAILRQLRLNLREPFAERLKHRPPLRDLLTRKLPGDLPVAFSFQRHDRNYPGLVLIRKQDGSFLRRSDGSLFNVAQLARSVGNYPGYLTDGNTPQGVFSIQGLTAYDYITPTPAFENVVPFEVSVSRFFHDPARESEKWSVAAYENLLPASWKGYAPIYEAYAAGEIGRSDMVGHGTTKNSNFHKGLPYYPNTPTHGCLCALELWSPVDGHCLCSDQLALASAFWSTGARKGYVVVVELNDEHRPVSLYDVLPDIIAAEAH
jgi:hypothetical protein